jgi:hypothetical protein
MRGCGDLASSSSYISTYFLQSSSLLKPSVLLWMRRPEAEEEKIGVQYTAVLAAAVE